MPSIHPDYEYDIFISYRQNDNRSDKWVSNFVDALKEELEATLKNPISIYFDENPHDGLLETHQVDASLAKKLQCLVFIPIISQTYCDESSFAWEHEFMPFISMAKEDKLGMNITLSNGNVVSRVLPVKIHRLDIDDQNTLEAVLDGPLRSIGFIYQEAGVNRPLKPDDDRNLNLEKTDYHNQINKVANALKDIGLSLLKHSDAKISAPIPERERPVVSAKSSKKGIYIGLATIIIALLMYWGYSKFYVVPTSKNITIAVLAFDDDSPEGDQEHLGDAIAGEIINIIGKVDGFQVIGKESSFSFKGNGNTIKEIGETLSADMIVGGSVMVVDRITRINVWLTDALTGQQIWSKKYDRQNDELLTIIDKSAQSIAGSLKSELSIEELKDIKVSNDVDPEAYEYYLKGQHFSLNKYFLSNNIIDFEQSELMFISAISIDSTYAEAYAGLADLYNTKEWYRGDNIYGVKSDSVLNIGLSLEQTSAYLFSVKGAGFVKWNDLSELDSAFKYLLKAYHADPNFNQIKQERGNIYRVIGLYDKAVLIYKQLLQSDPLNIYIRQNLGSALMRLGEYEDAKRNFIKTLDYDATNLNAYNFLLRIAVFYNKDKNEAKRIFKVIQEISPGSYSGDKALLLAMDGKKEDALNLAKDMGVYSLLNMKNEGLSRADSLSTLRQYTFDYSYMSLLNDNMFDFIRNEPEFKAILTKAKKVHDERMAKYGHLFDE